MHPIPFEERAAWIEDREAWRRSLPPGPVPDFLTGLLLRAPDPRDDDLADDPRVAAQLDAGFPDSGDLTRYVSGGTYNQGAVPSCVAHTMALMQSGHQQQEDGQWHLFNAPRVHLETGPLDQGRHPDQLLRYCVNQGMPLANSEVRYRIDAYAFVQMGPMWADTIKAAIAAEKFITIAMLLPANFSYESSGGPTQNYHEVLIVGYRPDAFLIKNSWGSGWGRNGLGWVPIPFLTASNGQNGYVLAHAPTDQRTNPNPPPPPPPPPPPVVGIRVSGRLTGSGLDNVHVATLLSVAAAGVNGNLLVESVTRDDTTPPRPDPPRPDPPVGELVVTVRAEWGQSYPRMGRVWASVRDANGTPVQATLSGKAGSYRLRPFPATDTHWLIYRSYSPSGSSVVIDAVAPDGRRGRGEATVP